MLWSGLVNAAHLVVNAAHLLDGLLRRLAGEENDLIYYFLYVVIGAGAITVVSVAVVLTPELMRDKRESNNASRVVAKLEEADRLQQSDPQAAYNIYNEVLKEAKQHKLTDEAFSKKLADAEKSRTAMNQKVQDEMRENWITRNDLESGIFKRFGDIDIVFGYMFSTVYVPRNAGIGTDLGLSGMFFRIGYRKPRGSVHLAYGRIYSREWDTAKDRPEFQRSSYCEHS